MERKTVLVTGAGRGIGAAIAKRFASEGVNVVLHYFQSQESVNKLASECEAFEVQVTTVRADLRDKGQIDEMKAYLDGLQIQPNIIVNNAAVSSYGLLSDVSAQEWDDLISINLKAMFFCTQAFIGSMIQQHFGRIINISSVWGSSGASCEVLYSMSKGGVEAFSKALAKELAPSGITVNAVAPGVVETDMMNVFTASEKAELQNQIPMGRFASPEEIASIVYYLSLSESSYITGQIISPNGGWFT